jgi:metal-responsive CopG/Arc/MetJ family transcriptional regulator
MPARPVQISLDDALISEIDADPEVRQHGRSAFIRAAVRCYLQAKHRRAIDQAIYSAYGGKAAELNQEIQDLMDAQAWPEES